MALSGIIPVQQVTLRQHRPVVRWVVRCVSLPYNTGIGMSERDGARVDDGLMDGRTGLRWRVSHFLHVELVFGIELNWSGASLQVQVQYPSYCAVNPPQGHKYTVPGRITRPIRSDHGLANPCSRLLSWKGESRLRVTVTVLEYSSPFYHHHLRYSSNIGDQASSLRNPKQNILRRNSVFQVE